MTGWQPGDPLYKLESTPLDSVAEIRRMFELIPDDDGSPMKLARWPEPFSHHALGRRYAVTAYIGKHADRLAIHDGQHWVLACWPCAVRVAYQPRHARRTL